MKRLRRIALSCQGLSKTRPFGKGQKAALTAVEHLGYVQIDTLSVVERAHHHTLWNRVPDYTPDVLDALVRERSVFEYWSHAASYLPMKDYRFALPRMEAARRGESVYGKADPKYVRQVMTRITNEGPLMARDFKTATKRIGSWWNWKPAKQALEQLFMQGELMVSSRNGMQKVYDLRERVLPDNVNVIEPALEEFADFLICTSLRAHGFTTLQMLTHLRRGNALRNALTAVLAQKIESGTVVQIDVEGSPEIYADWQVVNAKLVKSANTVRLLSPFDNAVIHRDRIQLLFDFDYKLECYLPQDKRQYGYFSLPILFRDELVGRVDCKSHRRTEQFELIHLHLNRENVDWELFAVPFFKAAQRFARFNHCHSIALSKVSPRKLTSVFRRALNALD